MLTVVEQLLEDARNQNRELLREVKRLKLDLNGLGTSASLASEDYQHKLALAEKVIEEVEIFARCDCGKNSVDSHWNDVLAALEEWRKSK
jgi:hypothetical protein